MNTPTAQRTAAIFLCLVLTTTAFALASPFGQFLKVHSGDKTFPGQKLEIWIERSLSEYPVENAITNFVEYPQTGSVTCGPNAIRNVLRAVTGTLCDDKQLFEEAVQADQRGLKPIEAELKLAMLGLDPALLSDRGTTPIGNTDILTRHLAENAHPGAGAFASIPVWNERLLLIVDSINRGFPVAVPFVSGDYNHWVTVHGYNLDRGTLRVANAGQPEMSFEQVDRLNSWTSMPAGLMGRVFRLANKYGLGRHVLVFIPDEAYGGTH